MGVYVQVCVCVCTCVRVCLFVCLCEPKDGTTLCAHSYLCSVWHSPGHQRVSARAAVSIVGIRPFAMSNNCTLRSASITVHPIPVPMPACHVHTLAFKDERAFGKLLRSASMSVHPTPVQMFASRTYFQRRASVRRAAGCVACASSFYYYTSRAVAVNHQRLRRGHSSSSLQ